MKNKIIAFDFLRALAIAMIIPAHLSNFLSSTYSKLALYAVDPYVANMGLGLFIFMSGYLLYFNNHSIHSFQNILSFYRKRLLRIFPLYWAAIAAFTLVFFIFAPKLNSGFVYPNAEHVFTFHNVIVHILGLQIFLAPAYASPMLTLYFIGLIIVFYAVYPLIIMLSKDSKQLLLYSSLVFLGFLLISRSFNIIEHRFFMFFPVFIFGILTCKESLFEKSMTFILRIPFVKIFLAALPIIFVLIIVLGSRTALLLDPKVSLTITSAGSGTIGSSTVVSMLESVANSLGLGYVTLKFIIDSVLLNVFIITFCILEYGFAMKFIDDKLSNSWSSALTYIATASYCIYLFHRPFLALWNSATNFISNPFLHDAIVIFVALPLLLLISYHFQILELNLKKSFSHKKAPHRDFSLTDSTTDTGKLASSRSKVPGRRSKL
ncbi:MAG: acyltransferase family protein [Methanosarcina flavescens]|jgi:peptidoglycan/LPS O-acetylase OafA/YrhL|uniref:Acyltransferase n=1 Tax=Methanosarcina flavescens TaxID=1715806 RepID=A0A660HPT0_9EURY|nr:acyltransferase [Methanosarcina flavescens]AYK14066.1 acyltransferase [Methanosarcina flavescens]NLK32658.1 acyltransferase [Methanosarcina flavescens]